MKFLIEIEIPEAAIRRIHAPPGLPPEEIENRMVRAFIVSIGETVGRFGFEFDETVTMPVLGLVYVIRKMAS